MGAIRLTVSRWYDLSNADEYAAAREATRGRAGVYLLRRQGKRRPYYIGSSVPGQKAHWGARAAAKEAAPLRWWKTIQRHFHACDGGGRYSFGEDNFCWKRGRSGWELGLIATPPQQALQVEARAKKRYWAIWDARQAAALESSSEPAAPF